MLKDVCPNYSKETAAFALLKEILTAHKGGEIGDLSTQKKGQYIIDAFQACLKSMSEVPVVMPDIQKYK